MTSGAARDTVFQKIRPGACFKTGDFVKEMLGGAIVVRLPSQHTKNRFCLEINMNYLGFVLFCSCFFLHACMCSKRKPAALIGNASSIVTSESARLESSNSY